MKIYKKKLFHVAKIIIKFQLISWKQLADTDYKMLVDWLYSNALNFNK